MKLTYDPRHNIAYLRLREKSEQVDTIRVSDEMNVDISSPLGNSWMITCKGQILFRLAR